MGLQFMWIEANLLDFFLTDVQNSRGKFEKIKRKFAINPAPIASQLSLNAGGSRRTHDFLSNRLIPSQFNQELKNKEGIHRFLKRIFAQKSWPFDLVGSTI